MTPTVPEDVSFDSVPSSTATAPKPVNGHESFETAEPLSGKGVVESVRSNRDQPERRAESFNIGTPRAATRTLPHSLESEEFLLSCCLIDGAAVVSRCIEERITPGSFYDAKHGVVFDCLLDLLGRKIPIDVVVVAEELTKAKRLDEIGGFAFIAQVSGRVPTTAQAEYFITQVRDYAVRREIVRLASSAVEEAFDTTIDLAALTQNTRRRLDFATQPPRTTDLWPKPVSAHQLSIEKPATPDVLLEGVLYVGGTMLISGPSKSHKTFSALDSAIAIASGSPWLGFRTTQSPVLYLNLELQDFATEDRIAKICSARGDPPPKNLFVWNLRGRSVSLEQLEKRLPEMIQETGTKVVCIDPHYKVSAVSDMEENSNDSQGKLLTLMEGLCCRNGAALILTHHFAKGDASAKNAIDRASGGGVFARWGDVMLTFTPHEEDDAMSVEMSLRNFAPVQPFVVRWEYPRWIRDKGLDPADLKSNRGAKERHTPDQALRSLGADTMTYGEWLAASGFSESTFRRKREDLLKSGKVIVQSGVYRAVSK